MAPRHLFLFGMEKRRAALDELSREVSRLREDIAASLRAKAIEFLMRECALDRRGAEQAVDYVVAGKAMLGAPCRRTQQ